MSETCLAVSSIPFGKGFDRCEQGQQPFLFSFSFARQNGMTDEALSDVQQVNMIIQIVLQGIPLADLKADNSNPNIEANMIWPHAIRTIKCE